MFHQIFVLREQDIAEANKFVRKVDKQLKVLKMLCSQHPSDKKYSYSEVGAKTPEKYYTTMCGEFKALCSGPTIIYIDVDVFDAQWLLDLVGDVVSPVSSGGNQDIRFLLSARSHPNNSMVCV
jgi:hypothetical protein